MKKPNLSPKANTVTADGGQIPASTLKSLAAGEAPESHQQDAAENEVTPERGRMPAQQAVSIPRIIPVHHEGRLVSFLIARIEDKDSSASKRQSGLAVSSLCMSF